MDPAAAPPPPSPRDPDPDDRESGDAAPEVAPDLPTPRQVRLLERALGIVIALTLMGLLIWGALASTFD